MKRKIEIAKSPYRVKQFEFILEFDDTKSYHFYIYGSPESDFVKRQVQKAINLIDDIINENKNVDDLEELVPYKDICLWASDIVDYNVFYYNEDGVKKYLDISAK